MPESEIRLLVLAVLIQAPFAFRLGAAVRDGRELVVGCMFLALGAAIAALSAFLTGSLLMAVCAALAPILLVAHARFLAAHRAPFPAGGAAGEPTLPAAAAAPDDGAALPPDALHAGMAFIGDLLETADRVGELRHKRRLRQLERQQAERQAGAGAQKAPPERRLAVKARRDGPLWDFPKLPPPPDKR